MSNIQALNEELGRMQATRLSVFPGTELTSNEVVAGEILKALTAIQNGDYEEADMD